MQKNKPFNSNGKEKKGSPPTKLTLKPKGKRKKPIVFEAVFLEDDNKDYEKAIKEIEEFIALYLARFGLFE